MNIDNEPQMHHSSLNAYESDLHNLEFIADPLNRKMKVNEVINRVELNLIDDNDYDSIHSESQQQSALNTIDEARKYVLKQQLKHELSKKRIQDK